MSGKGNKRAPEAYSTSITRKGGMAYEWRHLGPRNPHMSLRTACRPEDKGAAPEKGPELRPDKA